MVCPICGKANDCQMNGDKKCWCFELAVDTAKLGLALKDKSKDQCLCRICLISLSI
ncbi:cysteine-rich CWC family protein [Polynucleobacter sphagniphilus]|uniref:cysteine-rich CWC family protein n=1 Tax=Polynucleobacter sphagniphilus TaxID=1743169 RepID=UPI003B8A95A5